MTTRCCFVALALLACAATAIAQQDIPVYAGRGAVYVHVPPGYVEGNPTALVMALHGYRSNARAFESYIQYRPLSNYKGFLLVEPNGLFNDAGERYWNATDACCGGESTADSRYLRGLIEVIKQEFTVDPRRVLVFGHSNGGFMAHRVGCDHADIVAAIVSFGGATWDDPSKCTPVAPIHALEIHGTDDASFRYGGGCAEDICYPSALETAQTWADLNHCTGSRGTPAFLDLTETVPGLDTDALTYTGCDAGGSSALWSVVGGPHHPELSTAFNDVTVRYLLNHPKPSGISCDDVASIHAECASNGTLAVEMQLKDSAHDGTTVDLAVDGALRVAWVSGSRARLVLADRSPGSHVVRVLEPAACAAEMDVRCGR